MLKINFFCLHPNRACKSKFDEKSEYELQQQQQQNVGLKIRFLAILEH